jgi:hypothetical protein
LKTETPAIAPGFFLFAGLRLKAAFKTPIGTKAGWYWFIRERETYPWLHADFHP